MHGEGTRHRFKKMAGGMLDGDEYMDIFLDMSQVSSANLSNIRYLAKVYDEAEEKYTGSRPTYERQLKAWRIIGKPTALTKVG